MDAISSYESANSQSQSADWLGLPRSERQAVLQRLINEHDKNTADQLLGYLRAEGGLGLYASAGPNYQYAIFGRDSLEAAEDLLDSHPDICKEIIYTIARLQGRVENNDREEERGKVHHEFRNRSFSGQPISHAAEMILQGFQHWGGSPNEMRYYGTVDATPLFVRLVDRYVTAYGDEVLDQAVTDLEGTTRSLRSHVRSAVEWLVQHIESSDWSLLEYKRLNPMGLPNQAWKDSETGYLHTDGSVARADSGIASIEVQGYAYDALQAAARLVALDDGEKQYFREIAVKLQDKTLEHLWMPSESFFAIGLDRDESGETRQVATMTSNAAAVLDSQLLLDLDEERRLHYVEPIVYAIMGPQFLTEAGIRTRALRHSGLIDIADYHGSKVSWPKETSDIARGLRRHGYDEQAKELEDRLLQLVARSGECYEFYYVDEDGQVKYHYRNEHPDEPEFHDLGAANLPEPCHLWTLSAIIHLALRETIPPVDTNV